MNSIKNTSKVSRIISTSEYYKNHSLSKNLSVKTKKTPETKYSYLPNEILIKIFDYLNINDLLNCSKVCRDWNKVSNINNFYLKWSKIYGFQNDLVKFSQETGYGYKKCFIKIYEQKSDFTLFKLSQKINNKINRYTGLPDLNILQTDIGNLEWCLEFLDKNSNCLLSLKSNEQNNFEASFSVLWYNSFELSDKVVQDMTKIKLSVNIPVFMDLSNGKLSIQKPKKNSININNKRIILRETNFNFKDFKNKNFKSFSSIEIYNDKLIKIFEIDKDFLFAFWTSNQTGNDLAFISFNQIFDFNIVNLLFKDELKNIKNLKLKQNQSLDLELDSKYGLHDYTVYFCIRNQTKTIFISHKQIVYKADIKKIANDEYVNLNVLECDFTHNIGPQLKMLPKFTWKSEMNPKNDIDLFGILDLCVFDSNNKLMISRSMPINFSNQYVKDQNLSQKFMVSENLKFSYKSENFILESETSCLKDEFTWNDQTNYHLNSFELFIKLNFIDEWFGTNFVNEKSKNK